MNAIIDFLKDSHHFEHLVAGLFIGFFSDSWYCAEYCSFGIGTAVEVKDYKWGGVFDFVDMLLVVIGGNIGYIFRTLIFGL